MDAIEKPSPPAPNWCRSCGKHWNDPNAFCLDPIHLPAIVYRQSKSQEAQ